MNGGQLPLPDTVDGEAACDVPFLLSHPCLLHYEHVMGKQTGSGPRARWRPSHSPQTNLTEAESSRVSCGGRLKTGRAPFANSDSVTVPFTRPLARYAGLPTATLSTCGVSGGQRPRRLRRLLPCQQRPGSHGVHTFGGAGPSVAPWCGSHSMSPC